jgi:hypothetical protein
MVVVVVVVKLPWVAGANYPGMEHSMQSCVNTATQTCPAHANAGPLCWARTRSVMQQHAFGTCPFRINHSNTTWICPRNTTYVHAVGPYSLSATLALGTLCSLTRPIWARSCSVYTVYDKRIYKHCQVNHTDVIGVDVIRSCCWSLTSTFPTAVHVRKGHVLGETQLLAMIQRRYHKNEVQTYRRIM